jgi:hypothetical protein
MTAKGIHMSTIRKTALIIAATGLLSAAWMANASDDAPTTMAAQSMVDAGGAYSVDATDRGGKESPASETAFDLPIFDWLRGLMD